MPWTLADPLTDAHRRRLTGAGVPAEVLDDLELRAIDHADLPDWFAESTSAIYLAPGVDVPAKVLNTMVLYPFDDV